MINTTTVFCLFMIMVSGDVSINLIDLIRPLAVCVHFNRQGLAFTVGRFPMHGDEDRCKAPSNC
jgi:hypothetical protein